MYTVHVKYPDGSEEYIESPISYNIGAIITVQKRRSGAVVVGRVSIGQVWGIWLTNQVSIGSVSTMAVRLYIKGTDSDPSRVGVPARIAVGSGGTTTILKDVEALPSSYTLIETDEVSIPLPTPYPSVKLLFGNDLVAFVDNVYVKLNGGSWQLVYNGNFELGNLTWWPAYSPKSTMLAEASTLSPYAGSYSLRVYPVV